MGRGNWPALVRLGVTLSDNAPLCQLVGPRSQIRLQGDGWGRPRRAGTRHGAEAFSDDAGELGRASTAG